MKNIFLIIGLILSSIVHSQNNELIEIENFGNNKGNLKMYIYNPSPNDTLPKKLLIAIHGCNQNAKKLNELAGISQLAKLTNTIVVFPQQKIANNATNCFNWFRVDDFTKDDGEISSIMEMYDYTFKNYNIQKNEVCIIGVSAGAAITSALGLLFPEKIKAICCYAGGPTGIATNPFSAINLMQNNEKNYLEEIKNSIDYFKQSNKTKIPLLITFHGLEDKVVKPINSTRIQNQWLLNFYNNQSITKKKIETYNKYISKEIISTENEPIIYSYFVETLSHQYLVDPKDEWGGKLTSNSLDIDYFATYYIFKDFGWIE